MSQVIPEYKLDDDYFRGDGFFKIYKDTYRSKIEELNRCIFYQSTGSDKYMVLNTEASLGKSLNTNKLIIRYYKEAFVRKKILIVKRFADDVLSSAEFLKDIQPDYFQEQSVLGITKDNWPEWRYKTSQLKNFRVLIITHQRYISLSSNNALMMDFSEERDILIVDEKVEFPVYTFSKMSYDYIHSLLPFGLEDSLSELCKPLKDMLSFYYNDTKTRNKIIFCNPKINKRVISRFLQLIEDNRDNIESVNLGQIDEFMKGIRLFYSTKCVYNGGRITTFDRSQKLWGLSNNIILDASGNIDQVYRLSNSNYSINRQVRVVDDRDINIYPVYYNSSISSIKKNQNEYLEAIVANVISQYQTNDKVLIVCHKKLSQNLLDKFIQYGVTDIVMGDDDYNEHKIAINWFGNIIGKNTYKDFNVCWIIGKPNIPLETYIVHYMQYSNADTTGRKVLDVHNGKFKDDIFKNVQEGEVASEIYQSIKRIQRNAEPRGRIYIVMNDEDILKKVLDDMKNPTIHKVRPLIAKVKQETLQTTKKEQKVDILVEYIKDLTVGTYLKKDICESLQLDKTHMSRYMNNIKISSLVESGYIQINKTSIVVLAEMPLA